MENPVRMQIRQARKNLFGDGSHQQLFKTPISRETRSDRPTSDVLQEQVVLRRSLLEPQVLHHVDMVQIFQSVHFRLQRVNAVFCHVSRSQDLHLLHCDHLTSGHVKSQVHFPKRTTADQFTLHPLVVFDLTVLVTTDFRDVRRGGLVLMSLIVVVVVVAVVVVVVVVVAVVVHFCDGLTPHSQEEDNSGTSAKEISFSWKDGSPLPAVLLAPPATDDDDDAGVDTELAELGATEDTEPPRRMDL
ncbi:hypothetical protein WICPIJ_004304 [Wickerhamomyces pijperi]|uniref:Uncharacterized protein n=1 Tax=Wickerhamomyces pijperi TaxID=599730 RepID=A0A9P8Q5T1_WICPI|nr:hypothetical protein WICPIJ_004304 [Wickerhamomyces pijperi]